MGATLTGQDVANLRCLSRLQLDGGSGAWTVCVAAAGRQKQRSATILVYAAQRPEDGTSQERLWRQFFEDQTKWVDSRGDKRHSKEANFRHTETGECLRIDDPFKPAWVRAKLKSLQDNQGVASVEDAVTVESLWQKYFEHPAQWWDNRDNKLNSRYPDFRHKTTKEALWVNSRNTPQWVTEALGNKASSKRTGGASWKSGTSSSGERGAGNAGNLRLPRGDVFFWTGLISQHAKRGQGKQALLMYEKMREDGVQPSSYTFVAALKACNSLQDLQKTKKIHAEVVNCGLESDVFVGTMLVDVYSKCGSVVDARHVFERMPHRDAVCWNAMIMGYAQEEGAEALQLYARMQQEGVVPDDRTYVATLKACSSLAGLEEENGYDRKRVKSQCLDHVRGIHSALLKGNFESDVFVGNMLVDAYAKCGSLVDARHVFEKMPRRDVISWNAMIFGYAQLEEGEEALHLYARMQEEGVVPNDRTFVGAVKACSSLAALEAGFNGNAKSEAEGSRCLEKVRAIHEDIQRSGYQSDVFVANMLVDVYAKCHSLLDARRVFDAMPHHTVVSWTAMILGYAQMGEGEEALELYTRMQQEGVIPDARTFVAALKACSSLSGLDKGKDIHAQISKTGLEATDSFVASSLIDMYGRCGSLVDAQQVFDKLPRKDLVSWSALIAGYARRGESQPVFNLFERMTKEGIQPNGMIFSSILTVCSHVGSVDEGQKYFEAMIGEFGITPTIEHYTCIIDLLGRAGKVDKAMAMAKSMPVRPDAAVWKTVLGACRKWNNVEVGREAFECAIRLDATDAAAYVLMINIYAAAEMWEDAQEIQSMRVKTQAWKQPGQSW